MVRVKVSRKAADRLAAGHPWIFSSDVLDRGKAAAGDQVLVCDQRGRPLGVAHYSSTSQITLRMLGPARTEADLAFFEERIGQAKTLRDRVVRGSEAYRLVHAEGDLLPGLVIDRYADAFSIQFLTQGMDGARELIVEALGKVLPAQFIVARNDVAVRRHESLPLENRVLAGEGNHPVGFRMNGLNWQTDLLASQKTGHFLDQRENYVAAAAHASGRALDCFTSTGGFALHLAARCEAVEGVDSSSAALEAATANRDSNQIANVSFRQADVFDYLPALVAARRRFGIVVLDPPAFAKSRSAASAALRGYREINYRALQLLEPGGVLMTCCCSHHVSEASFLETVAQAALDAGRSLRVLERRTQSQDHPILLTVPETHYLKCIILQALE